MPDISISVIIPTYNDSASRLERSINSVISQTFKDFEIIVIDDGSNIPFGGVEKIIMDSRIQWVSIAKNCGVAKARNSGIKKAVGEYIAFLDTGDWWEPEKLSRQINLFNSKTDELVLVYCSFKKHFNNGIVELRFAEKMGKLYRDLLIGQPITGSCSAVLTTKKIFEKVGGFYEVDDIPEDRDLWLRISKHGIIDFVPEFLTHIEVKPNSRAQNITSKKITYKRFIELHESELEKEDLLKKAKINYYEAIANRYFESGMLFQGIKYHYSAMILKPNITSFLNLFKGVFKCFFPKLRWKIKSLFKNKVRYF